MCFELSIVGAAVLVFGELCVPLECQVRGLSGIFKFARRRGFVAICEVKSGTLGQAGSEEVRV